MKFYEKSISSARKIRSINRPEVIIPGIEPICKPLPVRKNTTQRMQEKYKIENGKNNA